ncbi:ABC transporter substrate-binding protein [Ferviditalea candida]|uniref:ABC transporter substrate-binding protein n=1 Tax=Ferviditalea candida TaxID=3108399 RepID=A0ABU5ZLI5_9BACL|nr:ABC transporter substrate-binding protein [Paenibacillaceae bacterium T2]
MKKWFLSGLAFLLVMTVIFTGCSNGKDREASAGAEGEPIKIALSPWPGWFFWFLTEEKGFFKKHGVNVELKWFPVYSDSLQALSTGQVDANSQTLSDTLAPLSKGIGLKVVLVNDNSNGGDAIVAKPKIQSVKDLKGKTVATELGTVDHFLLLTALEQNGMSESDINYVNMTVNDAGPAFINGKTDASVLWEPFQTTAVKEGKGKVLFSSKQTPGLIPDLLVFREDTVTKRPEDVQKIIDAWFDTLNYFKEHPDESIAIMAKKADTSPEDFKLGLESVKIFNLDDNLKAFEPAESFESLAYTGGKTAEFLKKLNMIDKLPDVSKALEPKFVKNVTAR